VSPTPPTDGPLRRPHDSEADRESRHAPEDESRYDSRAQAKPGQELKVRIEFVAVDGPDGKHLPARRAAAVRQAPQRFAEHQYHPRLPRTRRWTRRHDQTGCAKGPPPTPADDMTLLNLAAAGPSWVPVGCRSDRGC
jgi:hypothetical protein